MTIRQYLRGLGATENELKANVIERMERAMMLDTDLEQLKPDTVLAMLEKAVSGVETFNNSLKSNINDGNKIQRELSDKIEAAKDTCDELRTQMNGARNVKINNPETRDAVMAFAATLNATKEIFGAEAMSGDVIVAAINAGSYMAWRSIMGPKDSTEQVKSNWTRVR